MITRLYLDIVVPRGPFDGPLDTTWRGAAYRWEPSVWSMDGQRIEGVDVPEPLQVGEGPQGVYANWTNAEIESRLRRLGYPHTTKEMLRERSTTWTEPYSEP